MNEAVSATWVDNEEDLHRTLDAAAAAETVALDTEFMRRDTFHPRLALLQFAAAGHTALIDPLSVRPDNGFAALLERGDTCCIMHSASEDIEALAAWLPAGPARLFDTQVAAALAGLRQGIGYQALVLELLGVEVDKGETRSDWLQRPLSASQRAYAANDVAHLPALRTELEARLRSLGRLDWLYEDTARLCRRMLATEPDPQPQRRLHAAAGWSRPQQALLRRLLLWRERTARAIDRPRPWLITDAQALALAHEPPAELESLRNQLRGQRALRSAQSRELLDEIRRPLEPAEIETTTGVVPAPDRRQRDRLKELKQAVNAVADPLNLPASVLAPRRLLEDLLLEDGPWPEELAGWRRPLLEPVLRPLLDP